MTAAGMLVSASAKHDENRASSHEDRRERSGHNGEHAEPAEECNEGEEQADCRQINEGMPLARADATWLGKRRWHWILIRLTPSV